MKVYFRKTILNIQDSSRNLEMYYKQTFLKIFAKCTEKKLCWSLFYNQVVQTLLKETLEQVFPHEFSEIFQKSFFVEKLHTAASGVQKQRLLLTFSSSHQRCSINSCSEKFRTAASDALTETKLEKLGNTF